ncbi:MAG TPA: hypothetical protein VKG68_01105, partial [Candidatus Binatus sp.]|nr:hypothetical protein [Candidatus Binatus sp.]
GVVIFGASEPARWRPLGRIVVLGPGKIDSIEPDEVAAELIQICGRRDAAQSKKNSRVDYKNRVA